MQKSTNNTDFSFFAIFINFLFPKNKDTRKNKRRKSDFPKNYISQNQHKNSPLLFFKN